MAKLSTIGELTRKVVRIPPRRLKRKLINKVVRTPLRRLRQLKRKLVRKVRKITKKRPVFHGSEDYWITRYATGGNSGAGSYNKLAEYKAEVLNDFVKRHNVESVIEYGCGDGNQLKLTLF